MNPSSGLVYTNHLMGLDKANVFHRWIRFSAPLVLSSCSVDRCFAVCVCVCVVPSRQQREPLSLSVTENPGSAKGVRVSGSELMLTALQGIELSYRAMVSSAPLWTVVRLELNF